MMKFSVGAGLVLALVFGIFSRAVEASGCRVVQQVQQIEYQPVVQVRVQKVQQIEYQPVVQQVQQVRVQKVQQVRVQKVQQVRVQKVQQVQQVRVVKVKQGRRHRFDDDD